MGKIFSPAEIRPLDGAFNGFPDKNLFIFSHAQSAKAGRERYNSPAAFYRFYHSFRSLIETNLPVKL